MKLITRNSMLASVLLVFGMSISSCVNAVSSATTHKTVQVNGLDIFYREAGPENAPTILLLHGYPTSSHMFRNLIRDLSDQYHLLAPDYPGFGRSDQRALRAPISTRHGFRVGSEFLPICDFPQKLEHQLLLRRVRMLDQIADLFFREVRICRQLLACRK